MITLDGLTRRYGATTALHPTTLHLPAGQTTVLLGPSGCGKSTLLRLIMGLLPADAGTVRIGETLLTPSTVQALRHRMGYVIQDGGLFPHLTARANITLLARHLGWPTARIAERLGVLLPLAHLPTDVLDRYPLQLSGGQRQRVALLRALLPNPDVLLLDEPLGALDPMIRADLQQDLRAIFRQLGKTVVLVTHDLAEAAFFGDRLVLLREGRIVQQGTFADLVHHPAEPFVTAFINAQRTPLEMLGGGV